MTKTEEIAAVEEAANDELKKMGLVGPAPRAKEAILAEYTSCCAQIGEIVFHLALLEGNKVQLMARLKELQKEHAEADLLAAFPGGTK